MAQNAGGSEVSAIADFEVKRSWLSQAGPQITAGATGLAAVGLAVAAWRKGYFRKKEYHEQLSF